MRDVRVHEGFIPALRGRVWYRTAPDAAGTPLLMLHGGTIAASGLFAPLLAIADDRPVILYDQLEAEHLDGAKPLSAIAGVNEIGFERFLADVDRARGVVGEQPLHLIGHSWGAPLALEFALRRPAAVASLIVDLVEPPRFDLRAEQPGPQRCSMVEKLAELDRAGHLEQLQVPALLICARQADCLPELTDWYQGLMPGAEVLALHRPRGVHRPEDTARLLWTVNEFLRRAEGKAGLASDAPPLALAA